MSLWWKKKLVPSTLSRRSNNLLSVMCCILLLFMYYIYAPRCYEREKAGNGSRTTKITTTEATTTTITTKDVTDGVMRTVEFIDIIGIGIYTWHHLLNGSLDVSDREQIYHSNKTIDGISFKFKLKCCHPSPAENFMIDNEGSDVILAMWGRSNGRTQAVKLIRRILADNSTRNLALLIFGDLECKDDYLKEALRSHKLKFVYITHESNMIDGKKVFIWPLGTQMASDHKVRHNCPYINPKYEPVDLNSTRRFTSTFIGSIWDFRKPRQEVITKNDQLFDNDQQLISFQPRWKNQSKSEIAAQLSTEGVDLYEYSLTNSDLTLSPRGRAAECYRTFEALEFGSIPIISNLVQKTCLIPHEHNETIQSPNRIFKLHDAPMYYVDDWARDLPRIMREFEQLSPAEKGAKRRRVHEWYNSFKVKMGRKLVDDVKKFFV